MKQQVYDFLDQENIQYEVTEHEPVLTMDDMVRIGLPEKGTLCKNMFVRDQKGKRHWLIVADNDTQVDLRSLGEKIGAGKVSFASADRLKKQLGLATGYVSPFGVINNEDHMVTVVFDKVLEGQERLGIHPNTNEATIWISFNDLVKAIEKIGNDVQIVRM